VGWPVVATGNGRSICNVSFVARQPGEDELWLDRQINRESAANALLIAAAPEMLAALRPFARARANSGTSLTVADFDRAVAAIAKAEGRP